MRVILQRVTSASVVVAGEVVAQIGAGLLVLAGITVTDEEPDAEWCANKILSTRLWDSLPSEGKPGKPWNESVKSQDLEVLLVSQFTLHGILKGKLQELVHRQSEQCTNPRRSNLHLQPHRVSSHHILQQETSHPFTVP